MPTTQELLDAIAASDQIVSDHLDAIQVDINGLKDQIAALVTAGGGATTEQLQTVLDAANTLVAKAGGIDSQTP